MLLVPLHFLLQKILALYVQLFYSTLYIGDFEGHSHLLYQQYYTPDMVVLLLYQLHLHQKSAYLKKHHPNYECPHILLSHISYCGCMFLLHLPTYLLRFLFQNQPFQSHDSSLRNHKTNLLSYFSFSTIPFNCSAIAFANNGGTALPT